MDLIKNLLNEIKIKSLNQNNLKKIVLKQAFEGKLIPQDPNDEQDEILLQKIKQENQQLIQKQKSLKRRKNVK